MNKNARSGETALHHGIYSGNKELVEYVIESGAQLNSMQMNYKFSATNYLQKCSRQSPLILSADQRHFDICRLLIQHGCDMSFVVDPVQGRETLLRIVNSGDLDLVMVLVYAAGNHDWMLLIPLINISFMAGDELIQQLLDWLKTISSRPFPLKSLCRLFLRDHMRTLSNNKSIIPLIKKLPLPHYLREFLCLKIV